MHGWIWIACGAVSAALAVVVGALAAHVTSAAEMADLAQQAAWLATGQRYHMAHALGLILIGGLIALLPGRLASLSAWSLLLGSLCFSGGLYVQGFTGSSVGLVVPLGGLLFISGWLLLAAQACLSWRRSA
ncbi:MAG: DUF423 domain-containing protein [Pseudomonadota bacterium]